MYSMLKNLVLVILSGGKCIPDGKDWLVDADVPMKNLVHQYHISSHLSIM